MVPVLNHVKWLNRAKRPIWDRPVRIVFYTTIIICIGLLLRGCSEPGWAMDASWYSTESLKKEGTWKYSHGRMANGEKFDDKKLTCATRLWPLGTILRITNIQTNESVSVKVTDRIGKRFAKKRIDLSKKAFEEIADLNQGIIPISVKLQSN